MSLWLKNGKIILLDGEIILCEECPCGTTYPFCFCGLGSVDGSGTSRRLTIDFSGIGCSATVATGIYDNMGRVSSVCSESLNLKTAGGPPSLTSTVTWGTTTPGPGSGDGITGNLKLRIQQTSSVGNTRSDFYHSDTAPYHEDIVDYCWGDSHSGTLTHFETVIQGSPVGVCTPPSSFPFTYEHL
jgi:hypothetical protein